MRFIDKLYWPENVAHTKQYKTRRTKRTWGQAIGELQKEVKILNLINVIVTANINVTGTIIHSTRSDIRGVSVQYTIQGSSVHNKIIKLAYCDRFMKDSDNLQAIVESLRYWRKTRKNRVGFTTILNNKKYNHK